MINKRTYFFQNSDVNATVLDGFEYCNFCGNHYFDSTPALKFAFVENPEHCSGCTIQAVSPNELPYIDSMIRKFGDHFKRICFVKFVYASS